jgi:hypothetical protein
LVGLGKKVSLFSCPENGSSIFCRNVRTGRCMKEKPGLNVNGKKIFTGKERTTNVTLDLRSYFVFA